MSVKQGRERWAIREAAWGDHEPAPIPVEIGPWRFELRGDELADLEFEGSPVVRSVRAVARDRDWGTVPAEVESFTAAADGCDIRIGMRGLGADLDVRLQVRADETRLSVRLLALSGTEFLSNRLGLVVLHPPALAGAELTIGHPDGGARRAVFPVAILPHQPARDIRSLAWTHDGVATTLAFEGEVFEMEDQRNWTDASYKTYSTPLSLPFPVRVEAGASIEQSVVFESVRVADRSRSDAATARVVELVDSGLPVPALTLGASTVPDDAFAPTPLPAGLAGVLVELDTRTPSWRAALERARREAGDLPLDVRITTNAPSAVREAVEAAAGASPVARLGVFAGRSHVTEPELWSALSDAAAQRLPASELVGGARSHFTELNRGHGRLPDDLPAITFAMTPQMHATERAQLVESIGIQAAVVRDAARIAAGRPLHVGPITLRSRYNAVATSVSDAGGDPTLAAGYGAQLVPGATDARQSSVALAAWTVASFAAICTGAAGGPSPIASVDYFEAVGSRGIRGADGPYPVAGAVAAIAELHGARLLAPPDEVPEGVWLIAGSRSDGSWRLLAASLADEPVSLTVRHGGGELDVTVAPYEVVALDSDA